MKLKRVAVLIEGFDSGKRASVLQQFKFDSRSFKLFLQSPIGGLWKQNEIICLISPSLKELEKMKEKITADYVLLYFSGHGNAINGGSYIALSEYESIEVKQLPCFADKQLFVFDSCRGFPEPLKEIFLNYPERISIDEHLVRSIYEEYLRNCGSGTTYCFSCSYGNSSYSDNFSGGYFTNSLITEVTAWAISKSDAPVLSVLDACNLSFRKIRLCYDYQQQPVIITSSDGISLPFAINLRKLLNEKDVRALFDFSPAALK
jgi:Caspase domain